MPPLYRLIRHYLDDYIATHEGHLPEGKFYDAVIGQAEQALFDATLHHAGGNVSQAAKLLGIHRDTLARKCRRKPSKMGRV